jgi:hypothetical protein
MRPCRTNMLPHPGKPDRVTCCHTFFRYHSVTIDRIRKSGQTRIHEYPIWPRVTNMKRGFTMGRRQEDYMEDLGYDGYETEGTSEMFEGEDGFDDFDAAEEADLGAEEGYEDIGFEEGFNEEFEDSLEEGFDEFEDYGDEFSDAGEEQEFEDAMAYAMGAEDSDEFFRRLMRGVRRVAGTVGRVARVAAPIARLIPHPYAQVAARGLGLLGRLRAEGASEEEAMDSFAELAAYDESVLPIAAGLAARNLVRGRGARLPMPARRILIRNLTRAARTLTARRGPQAIRALPRIARSVRRTAAARRTPVRVLPRIIARTVANVARNANLIRRLARPLPAAARRVRTVLAHRPVVGSAPRTFTLQGPVRISITSVG